MAADRDDFVQRSEYERMRSLADAQHRKYLVEAVTNMDLRAENERMREALRLICSQGITVTRCFNIASKALSDAVLSGSQASATDGGEG